MQKERRLDEIRQRLLGGADVIASTLSGMLRGSNKMGSLLQAFNTGANVCCQLGITELLFSLVPCVIIEHAPFPNSPPPPPPTHPLLIATPDLKWFNIFY